MQKIIDLAQSAWIWVLDFIAPWNTYERMGDLLLFALLLIIFTLTLAIITTMGVHDVDARVVKKSIHTQDCLHFNICDKDINCKNGHPCPYYYNDDNGSLTMDQP